MVDKYKQFFLIYFLCFTQMAFAFDGFFMSKFAAIEERGIYPIIQTMIPANKTKTKQKHIYPSILSDATHSFSLSILPPTHLHGRQIGNRFASQTDLVNHMTWRAPTGGTTPVAYRIYRDAALTDLVAIIPADAKLKFNDHHRKKHRTYFYFIVSVDEVGQFSFPIGIEFKGSKTRLIATELKSIVITPINPMIVSGLTQQFIATGLFSHDINLDITNIVIWASSEPSVAEISTTGLVEGLVPGTTLITASFGSLSASTLLTVASPTLIAIEISPVDLTLPINFTQQFKAIGIFSDGAEEDLTHNVMWSSSNPVIATITADGLATGLVVGTTTITAALAGTSFIASTTLIISSATLTNILVFPSDLSIPFGISQQFDATGVFSDGSTLEITNQVMWSSSNSMVAIIDVNGLATGISAGTTTLTAALGAISGSTILTVTNDTLIAIIISPTNISIPKGTTQQFTATGVFTDGTERDITTSVTWTSSNSSVAIIDSTGLVTGIKKGTVAITAVLGSISEYTLLTVTEVTLISLNILPVNPTLLKEETQQFTAIGFYSDGSIKDITTQVNWTSSEPSVATVGRHTGLARAREQGDTLIRAHLGGIYASTTLHVNLATLQSIEVVPPDSIIHAGFEQQFTAIGTYSNGSIKIITDRVKWSSQNSTIASIKRDGLATGSNPGVTIITATLNGISGSTTLTVSSATLISIVVTPPNPRIPEGMTQQFEAIGIFSDEISRNITNSVHWGSSNTQIATIQTKGNLSPGLAKSNNSGTTTITAERNGISSSTTLTVSAVLTEITLSPLTATIGTGITQQFTAIGTFSNGSTRDITKNVIWHSSHPSVALIGSRSSQDAGLAVGLKEGTTQITATLGAVTSITPALLTVKNNVVLQSILVIPVNHTVPAGIQVQFMAIGTFSDGSSSLSKDITNLVSWSSSNSFVATIHQKGSTDPGLAKTHAPGKTIITANYETVIGSTTLNVNHARLVSIQVTPANPTIMVYFSQQFTATGTYTDGKKRDLTSLVTWSSNQSIASITSTGLATGVNPGSSAIVATLGTLAGSTTLTVSAASLSSISISPAGLFLPPNTSQQFTATGTLADSNSTTIDITNFVEWSSSDSTVATIQTTGSAQPGMAMTGNPSSTPASTTIMATLQGMIGSTVLTVTPLTLTSITITPPVTSIFVGNTQQFTAIGTFSDGSTLDITDDVFWQILPVVPPLPIPAAIVNSTGLVTAVSRERVGEVFLQASSASILDQAIILINTLDIVITPLEAEISIGQVQQFQAFGFINGTTKPLGLDVIWGVSNPSAASIVGGQGSSVVSIEGNGSGKVHISAAVENIQAPEALLTVGNP